MSAQLATTYLGMDLGGPVIASASPLTEQVSTLRQLEDAGAAAVVLPSLFEEDVIEEELHLADTLDAGMGFAEFDSAPLAPTAAASQDELGTERHLNLVSAAKEALDIPVIGSINGAHPGSWQVYASLMAQAGADAIELNMYSVAADPTRSAADVEEEKRAIVREVRAAIDVPLAVKLSPFYTSLAHLAAQMVRAGADGLVLFNRFYSPDIDLATLELAPRLALSAPEDLRLPLRWLGILRAQLADTSLAATTGIHTGDEVLKALLVGADVACTTAAVLQRGPEAITRMLEQVSAWLAANEYESVAQLRSSMSAANVPDPGGFERAQYRAMITSYGR